MNRREVKIVAAAAAVIALAVLIYSNRGRIFPPKYEITEPDAITLNKYDDGTLQISVKLEGDDLKTVGEMIVSDWNRNTDKVIKQYMMLYPEDGIAAEAVLHYDEPVTLTLMEKEYKVHDIYICLDQGKDYCTFTERHNTAFMSHMYDETIEKCMEILGAR